MPVMDRTSFAAITRSLGIDGVMAQFRSLGIDQETFRRVVSALSDDESEVDDCLVTRARRRRRIGSSRKLSSLGCGICSCRVGLGLFGLKSMM
jgi:hypothetical protein